MTDFGKLKFSASTSGMGVLVAGTTTATATLIHTAVSGTVDGVYDEIWLYAVNNSAADVLLTIEFGNSNAANNWIVTVPAKKGAYWIIPGQPLQGGLTVKAFAATTNVITLHGWVNTMRA